MAKKNPNECSAHINEGNKCCFGMVGCCGITKCREKYPDLQKSLQNKY